MKKIMFLLMFLGALPYLAHAANYDNPVDGIYRGAYGNNSIAIEVASQVDKSPVTNDQNGLLTFQLTGNTAYKNFSQLTDLKNGDEVSIGYSQNSVDKTQRLVAESITKVGPEVDADNGATVVNTQTAPVPETQTTVTTTTTRVE